MTIINKFNLKKSIFHFLLPFFFLALSLSHSSSPNYVVFNIASSFFIYKLRVCFLLLYFFFIIYKLIKTSCKKRTTEERLTKNIGNKPKHNIYVCM